jgi:hypothetical protein
VKENGREAMILTFKLTKVQESVEWAGSRPQRETLNSYIKKDR